MIVYLIHHGHTASFGTEWLRGLLDEPLDDQGRTEAQRLGELFAHVDLVDIVASPLVRTVATAQAIARPHGLHVKTHAGLIDRSFGPWEGKSRALVEERYGTIDNAPPAEIEPEAKVARRAVAAWDELTRDRAKHALALVMHDAVAKSLIRLRCENCRDLAESDIPQPTGCWSRILLEGTSCRCEVVGATPGDGTRP